MYLGDGPSFHDDREGSGSDSRPQEGLERLGGRTFPSTMTVETLGVIPDLNNVWDSWGKRPLFQ